MSAHEAKWREVLQIAALRQREGSLAASESLLVKTLNELGAHADALHLLGLSRARQGHGLQAVRLLFDALELCRWSVNPIKKNLSAIAANFLREQAVTRPYCPASDFSATRPPADAMIAGSGNASVSLVILANDSATDLRASLESVRAQKLRPDVVTISYSDGTLETALTETAGLSVEGINQLAARVASHSASICDSPVSHRIDAAIQTTTGQFVQLMNAGDLLMPDRLSALVGACLRSNLSFAFSRVQFFDQNGPVDALSHAAAFSAACAQSELAVLPCIELGVLRRDVIYGLSNLFFSREVFNAIREIPKSPALAHWMYALTAIASNNVIYIDDVLCQLHINRGNRNFNAELTVEEQAHYGLQWRKAIQPLPHADVWATRMHHPEESTALAYLETAAILDGFAQLKTVVARILSRAEGENPSANHPNRG